MGSQRRACVNQPRRRWSPTWRRTDDDSLKRVKSAQGHAKEGGMESSGATIMATSGYGRRGYFNDGWRAWEHYALGVLLRTKGDRVWVFQLQSVGNFRMAE